VHEPERISEPERLSPSPLAPSPVAPAPVLAQRDHGDFARLNVAKKFPKSDNWVVTYKGRSTVGDKWQFDDWFKTSTFAPPPPPPNKP
jgi:hypothetical protein